MLLLLAGLDPVPLGVVVVVELGDGKGTRGGMGMMLMAVVKISVLSVEIGGLIAGNVLRVTVPSDSVALGAVEFESGNGVELDDSRGILEGEAVVIVMFTMSEVEVSVLLTCPVLETTIVSVRASDEGLSGMVTVIALVDAKVDVIGGENSAEVMVLVAGTDVLVYGVVELRVEAEKGLLVNELCSEMLEDKASDSDSVGELVTSMLVDVLVVRFKDVVTLMLVVVLSDVDVTIGDSLVGIVKLEVVVVSVLASVDEAALWLRL